MKGIILTVLLFSTQAFANGTLEKGEVFSHTTYQGEVSISCPDSGIQYYRCTGYDLYPSNFSKFVTDNTEADRVELVATHEDGSTRTKSGKMKKGTSKKRFNLWIRTLFQRPLLEMGRNQITYKLSKNDNLLESGQFDVEVNRGASKQCRRLHLVGSRGTCNMTSACDTYFRRTTCR